MLDADGFLVIFFIIFAAFFVLIWAVMIYTVYRKNKANLEAQNMGVRIKPIISRFLLSWYIYLLFFFVPLLPIVWFIPEIGKQTFIASLVIMPIMWLFFSIAAYPYYVLVAYEQKLNGATLSGMFWKRTEMNISEIDADNVLRQNLGRKFGIVVFRSKSGTKILSLGLEDVQVMNILEMSRPHYLRINERHFPK